MSVPKDFTRSETFQEITRRNNANRRSLVLEESDATSSGDDEFVIEDDLDIAVEKDEIKLTNRRDGKEILIKSDQKAHLHVGDDREVSIYIDKLCAEEKIRTLKTGEFRSRLADVKFDSRHSIFDSDARKHKESAHDTDDFFGFYVLFWLSVAMICGNVTYHYIVEHGNLWYSEIVQYMRRDVFWVAVMDLKMYAATYFGFLLQLAIKRGLLKWDGAGWIVMSVYEVGFFCGFLYEYKHKGFPWIAEIFLCLHSFVLLMKMHSYAFYNGYLWRVSEELQYSKAKQGQKMENKYREIINKSVLFCEFELSSQSTKPENRFPANITLWNFFMYSSFPTVVYSIEYPRTKRIRWTYVGEKLLAIGGCIFIMIIVAQNFMYPVAMRALEMRYTLPFTERVKQWPILLLDIVPGFIVMYLMVWYLIWDAILNCIAELTMFGDRYFYGDWWNCVTWDEFARLWNVPVHKFLLRHVYHSSLSALKLNKTQATLVTFLISAVVHEITMYVLFNKIRCYLFLLQMGQLPLVALSRTRWLKDKKLLGNVIFWIGIATGPSIMCTLYLTF